MGPNLDSAFISLQRNAEAAAGVLASDTRLVVAFPAPTLSVDLDVRSFQAGAIETRCRAYQARQRLTALLRMRSFPPEVACAMASVSSVFELLRASAECLLQIVVTRSSDSADISPSVLLPHRDYDKSRPESIITRLICVFVGAPTVWFPDSNSEPMHAAIPFPHAVVFNSSIARGPLHMAPNAETGRLLVVGTLFGSP